MNSKKIAVLIKDKNNQLLNQSQTTRLIDSIKWEINPDCRSKILNHTIQDDKVFISNDDLFILEIKLARINYSLIKTTQSP